MIQKIFLLLLITLNIFAYEKTTDDKNVYFESQHFRVVIGIRYSNSVSMKNLAYKYLDNAEFSWSKEIDELGFRSPKNTEIKKIDMFVGNRYAYNYETNSYENIPSNYAGWTTSYPSDGTPYFVLSSDIDDNSLKVTISHEFFHTIQYAYINNSLISDDKWFKNVWWLEATAVLLEDEVYDDINDYLWFLDPFFTNSYKNFEIYDGTHEYAMVIFAKYIREKYGMGIIEDSFKVINSSGEDGFFEILDTLLIEDYNSNMKIALNEFAKWVSNPPKYFSEGSSYPELKHFKLNDSTPIEKGGVKIVDSLVDGWNMVALSESDLNVTDLPSLDIIWGYKDGRWSNSIYGELNHLNSSDGYWVKANAESSLYYTYFDKSIYELSTINNEWNFLATTKPLSLESLDVDEILIWQFRENQWYAYSNNEELKERLRELDYPILEVIPSFSAYWIKKL